MQKGANIDQDYYQIKMEIVRAINILINKR